MMAKGTELRREFLETLLEKAEAGLSWKMRGDDSYETVIEGFAIHADKRIVTDNVYCVVWIFDDQNTLIDSIYEIEFSDYSPNLAGYSSYAEIVRKIYEIAENNPKNDAIMNALNALKRI